jgi:two-component system, chemotaxis family, chemotaxis protein CheY
VSGEHGAYGEGISSVAAGSLAVELLPEGTRRLGRRTPIGPRLAFVIDSTPTMRTIQGTLLQVHGFSVESFAALDVAMRRCGEVVPDVVVMEPHDAAADALDVLRSWHQAVQPAAPPVVWCTTVTPTQQHLDTGASLGLRGVVVKPFRLEALLALVVRVARTHEREARLRKLGVDLRRLAGPLSPDEAQLWLRVESELAAAHQRPLSLVCAAASSPAVLAAVRSVIRNVDLVARLDESTLAVLLPDVDAQGAEIVAWRVTNAATSPGLGVPVRALTRGDGESAEALLSRALRPG